MKYWLFKSEPSVFSIQDLQSAPSNSTFWDGVRNYQARNFLRDEIKPGDGVLFYHSNAEPSGIAGIAEVTREGYPDHTAFDKKDPHYDPKSNPASPTWYMVDIRYTRSFTRILSLEELRTVAVLKDMVLLQKGSRLSIQPVTAKQWNAIIKLADK